MKPTFFFILFIRLSFFASAQNPLNTAVCKGDTCTLIIHTDESSLKRMVIVSRNANRRTVFNVADKKSFGFCNTEGKKVIPFSYDAAQPFFKGYSVVTIGDNQGIIDSTGKLVVPLKYKGMSNVSDGVAFYSLKGDQVNGLVDIKGKEHPISSEMGLIGTKLRGIAIINIPTDSGRFLYNITTLIPYTFSEGLAVINNKVMNTQGNFLFTSPYTIFDCKDGMLRICKKLSNGGDWYGFMDKKGNVVIPPIYSSAYDFNKGTSTVMLGNPVTGKTKVIDKTGKEIMKK